MIPSITTLLNKESNHVLVLDPSPFSSYSPPMETHVYIPQRSTKEVLPSLATLFPEPLFPTRLPLSSSPKKLEFCKIPFGKPMEPPVSHSPPQLSSLANKNGHQYARPTNKRPREEEFERTSKKAVDSDRVVVEVRLSLTRSNWT